MFCRTCGLEMIKVLTGDFICHECGIKRNSQGKFISRDVKVKKVD
jgi:predicted RNA-binding Zn-ribbon protein involved in translation (DUF1610 family)